MPKCYSEVERVHQRRVGRWGASEFIPRGLRRLVDPRGGGADMTKSELVDAYIRGEMDRRGFITKLTAMGVSATAAAAYAVSFAQNAAASPARNPAGFVARGQDTDEEYGTAFIIELIEAAINALLEAVNAIVETLDELFASFTSDDLVAEGFDATDFTLLQTIREQIDEQLEALNAFLVTATGSGARNAFQARTYSTLAQTPEDSLQEILT